MFGEHAHEVFDGLHIQGDIDGDGSVQLKDAQDTLGYALKIKEPELLQLLAGDMDGNGSITLSEAQQILKVALKITE